MRGRISSIALICLSVGPAFAGPRLPLPTLEPKQKETLLKYLAEHPMTPEDYVVSKFVNHDVVFLGEFHHIKHDPQLIAALIPRLYHAGVSTLAIEFARRQDQALIDKLLSGSEYDEALAREIQFIHLAYWGDQEYLDIYRAAWSLNHSLPAGGKKFRILGMNDSPNWSLVKNWDDWENDVNKIRHKVWQGGGEDKWAGVILQAVAKNEKVLVYSGLHHAFTEYLQPVVQGGKFVRYEEERMGTFVYRKIGKRAVTIALHAPWDPITGMGEDKEMIYPVEGVIDALMRELPAAQRRRGFDTAGTPFGPLPAKDAYYSQGYPKFTLAALCDGYIIQGPLSEYKGTTPAPGFINEKNLERAHENMPDPASRIKSAAELMKEMAENTDIPTRFARLQ